MPTLGGIEMLIIAIVAIVVVGPKDLPKLMRGAGTMLARLRGMASEFQNSVNELSREAELEDIRREMAELKSRNVITEAKRDIDRAVNAPVIPPAPAPPTGEDTAPDSAPKADDVPGPRLEDARG